MITADVHFLTGAVIKRHLRSTCSSFAAGNDVYPPHGGRVWTALTLYRNVGHKLDHQRTSLLALISVHL
jgi:hypothetical protein